MTVVEIRPNRSGTIDRDPTDRRETIEAISAEIQAAPWRIDLRAQRGDLFDMSGRVNEAVADWSHLAGIGRARYGTYLSLASAALRGRQLRPSAEVRQVRGREARV